jgi:hypothetical protein
MPILLELLVLMMIAYAAGMAIGWSIWGRRSAGTGDEDDG